MSWGSDVMMLGSLPSVGRSDGLGALAPSAPPIDWAFLLGSYTGAWAGGAGVGYIVGRKGRAALVGAVAASGIWGLSNTIASAREQQPLLSLACFAIGAGSLYWAWSHKGA